MNDIFIITASNDAAKEHVRATIENRIDKEKVETHFEGEQLKKIRNIALEDRYYAWGAKPGRGETYWRLLQDGDHVLIYQDLHFTYVSKVLFKAHNREFALDNWKRDPEDGKTWEYMYLLKKPLQLMEPVPLSDLSEFFPKSVFGFTRIGDDKISKIKKEFGSARNFIEKKLTISTAENEAPNWWWVCQGSSYTKELGQKFLFAPKLSKNERHIASWDTTRTIKPGDLIFNYAVKAIRGISVAKSGGYDFHNERDSKWRGHGTRVDIDHYPIDEVEVSELQPFTARFEEALYGKNGPFTKAGSGDVKQGYLFDFSLEAARILREIYGKPFPLPVEKHLGYVKLDPDPEPTPNIIELLKSKKQIILYGPPGTGKTFRARELAGEMCRD